MFLGSRVWDTQRYEVRCSSRENNINSSCRGKSVLGTPGHRSPWHCLIAVLTGGSVPGSQEQSCVRVAGVNLGKPKHSGADEERMGLKSDPKLVRPVTCLKVVNSEAFPERFLCLAFSLHSPFPLFYSRASLASPFHQFSKYLLTPTMCQTPC